MSNGCLTKVIDSPQIFNPILLCAAYILKKIQKTPKLFEFFSLFRTYSSNIFSAQSSSGYSVESESVLCNLTYLFLASIEVKSIAKTALQLSIILHDIVLRCLLIRFQELLHD